jgi:hypothetical protein
MWNDTQTLRHFDLVRHAAQTVSHLPFAGEAIVEACRSIEQAGMPAGYLLPATAREYAACQQGEDLAAALSCRIGNPRVPPTPPLWPLLGILLLGWGNAISVTRVMQQSSLAGMEYEAQRGLLIVGYLFPELKAWLARLPLKMPQWERILAVPLAARKLVLLDKTELPPRALSAKSGNNLY